MSTKKMAERIGQNSIVFVGSPSEVDALIHNLTAPESLPTEALVARVGELERLYDESQEAAYQCSRDHGPDDVRVTLFATMNANEAELKATMAALTDLCTVDGRVFSPDAVIERTIRLISTCVLGKQLCATVVYELDVRD